MNNVSSRTKKIFFLALAAIILNVLVAILAFNTEFPSISPFADQLKKGKEVKTFSSEQEFKDYLAAMPAEESYSGLSMARAKSQMMEAAPSSTSSQPSGFNMSTPPAGIADSSNSGIGGGVPDRFSETNVQVAGIDEPDIVKTDGKEIYFSSNQYWIKPMSPMGRGISLDEEQRAMRPDIYPVPPAYEPTTKIINAFPAADLAISGKIDKQGDLLLNKDILMVFGTQEITGFEVTNPKSPAQKWSVKLNDNNSVVSSRLYNGKVYLVTRSMINESRPCPLNPLSANGVSIDIGCGEIYHPIVPVPADSTFTAMILNTADGKIEKTVSFIGSSSTSMVYMSDNSLYITYSYSESIVRFFAGFFKANKDLFPSWLIQKMDRLDTYDISDNSKLLEFYALTEKYENSLGKDESLKLANEVQNRMSDYYKVHRRDLEKTGIVKIGLGDFKMASTGSVPGYLLNQFSMDEYEGNLRVATTIGQRFGWGMGISGQNGTTNDVYVLDKNMKNIGSVKDFGKTEQIYSVRFIEDKGYVVTFRQTDPFYVMDLSNPKDPKIAGELKIPGYSSYLHPLDATHILGVGMDGGKVKISLFDVSDKNNPVELDKYSLDEYWTDVSNNYHAFMIDKKHNVFFLPGGKGGYVFSYEEYKLKLQKAVSQVSARRAIYINDYLYVIGDDKITVLKESNWEKVNELAL